MSAAATAATAATGGKPVALVIGASRGLGRAIALGLARDGGYRVGVAAKSTHENGAANTAASPASSSASSSASSGHSAPLLGTVYSVCREIEALGGEALPLPCNVLVSKEIYAAVDATVRAFGRLDLVVYNAGAIWWDRIDATPTKRYDLMHGVNARGAYETVQAVLPLFTKQNAGRIILIAPPIYSRFFNGKTPYAMSKVAMTVLAMGLAKELVDAKSRVAVCTLWPATAVQSAVTDKLRVPLSRMRKDTIFADATLAIARQPDPATVNGRALIDEDFLRETGAVLDFSPYRCDPAVEPERMMPRHFPSLAVPEQDTPPTLGKPHMRAATNKPSAPKIVAKL